MAKFSKQSKLSKRKEQELLIDLCEVIVSIKKTEQAARFIKDLLSGSEATMLAKRIKIAEQLLNEKSYDQISENLKVSPGTIARVNEWLKINGEGYRAIIEKLNEKRSERKIRFDSEQTIKSDAERIKERYPLFYWPELMVKELLKSSDQEKEEALSILEEMDLKPGLYKKIEKRVRDNS